MVASVGYNTTMVKRRGAIFSQTTPDPLDVLIHQSDQPLLVVQTIFPFILFTDKVIIRTNHVDIVRGIFFWSATTTRIQISDIRQVEVQFNPFFASLEIIPQGPLEQTFKVRFLWINDAKKARRIISGLLESHESKIDLSRYKNNELVEAMEKVGKAKE